MLLYYRDAEFHIRMTACRNVIRGGREYDGCLAIEFCFEYRNASVRMFDIFPVYVTVIENIAAILDLRVYYQAVESSRVVYYHGAVYRFAGKDRALSQRNRDLLLSSQEQLQVQWRAI